MFLFIFLFTPCSKQQHSAVYQPPSTYGGDDEDVRILHLFICSIKYFLQDENKYLLYFTGGLQTEVIICGVAGSSRQAVKCPSL